MTSGAEAAGAGPVACDSALIAEDRSLNPRPFKDGDCQGVGTEETF